MKSVKSLYSFHHSYLCLQSKFTLKHHSQADRKTITLCEITEGKVLTTFSRHVLKNDYKNYKDVLLVHSHTSLCLDELILSTRTGHDDFLQHWLVNLNISATLRTQNKINFHKVTTRQRS